MVLMSTGKTALMNTMKIFDHMPIPNQISTSGIMATRGEEYSAVRNGSTTMATRRYQPITIPSTTPHRIAAPTPIRKLVPLYAMSCLRRPRVHSSTARVAIDEGPVKNRGEILPDDQVH